ncbi:MAG: hypothetical protein CL878_14595 [Dehalococcoidia bacterium]|nr:hypothetical protein [Dehalococcoidia bacterium]
MVVSAESTSVPEGPPTEDRRPSVRRWGLLALVEAVSATATAATLLTGQPTSLLADRYWAGAFTIAGLGSLVLTMLYVVSLQFLGRCTRAVALRRASLTLTPAFIRGSRHCCIGPQS